MLIPLIKIFTLFISGILIVSPTLAQINRSSLPDDQQTVENREKARQCSEVSGVYAPETGCFCPTLNEFISLNRESEKQRCQGSFAEAQMNSLLEINSREPFRKNCEGVCLENSTQFGCPRILNARLFQDQERSHLGIISSPASECETNETITPSELEADINQSNFIESFTPSKLVSSPSCLPQTINQQDGRSGRGHRGRVTRREVTPKDKTRFVADYYYSMKKLERSIEQTLTRLASLKEIVGEEGDSLLPEVVCDFQEFPALVEKCQTLKQCQAPGQSIDVAEQTIEAIKAKKLLEEELRTSVRPKIVSATDQYTERNRESAWSSPNPQNSEPPEPLSDLSDELESLTDEEKKLDSTIGMIDQLYPWINGNKFKPGFSDLSEEEKESPQNVASLLKDQAEVTKQELLETLKEQKQALKCLNSQTFDPEQCENVFEVIAQAPNLDDLDSQEDLNSSSLSALKAAQCREDVREQRESANDLVEGLALDALLMAGTLGLTGIALGGKAAVRVAKLLSGGRLTKPTRVMTGALLSAEVLASMDHAQHAVRECNENWNRIEGTQFQSNNNTCSEEIKETATLKSNYKSCLMEVGLTSLPFIVPGAVAVTRAVAPAVRAISERIKIQRLRRLSTTLLGRPPSDNQLDAISRAHRVGEDRLREASTSNLATPSSRSFYTKDEIRRKARMLQEAGFTVSQIRTLMEAGVVGRRSRNKNPSNNQQNTALERQTQAQQTKAFNDQKYAVFTDLNLRLQNLYINNKDEIINNLTRDTRQGERHRVIILLREVKHIDNQGQQFPVDKLEKLIELMNVLRKHGISPQNELRATAGIKVPTGGIKLESLNQKTKDRKVYHAHIEGGRTDVVCWERDANNIIQITYIGKHPSNYKVCFKDFPNRT